MTHASAGVVESAPPADLADLIESFAQRRITAGPLLLPVFPTGRSEILFHFGDPFLAADAPAGAFSALPHAAVLQPRAHASWQIAGPAIDWFLVKLTPLGCRRLLGVPLAALWGCNAPLDGFWGGRAGAVWEQLAAEPDLAARIRLIAPALRCMAAGREAAGLFARCGDPRRLARVASPRQIAALMGVSDRRVRQAFQAEIGRSPKTMLRIGRFGRYLGELHPARRAEAFEHGPADYFDDSHATREFRAFTGMTPGAYRRSKARGDALVFTGPLTLLGADRRPFA